MKKNLSQKLISYSALATAGILSTQKSEGQIVYTDVKDTTISSGVYYLDLNNDGIVDFYLREPGHGSFDAVAISKGSNDFNSVMGPTKFSSEGLPYALNFLDPISSAKPFFGGGVLTSTFSYPGYWGGVKNHYLGLEFLVGTDHYFGWARLNVASKARHFTVKDYAYNSVPGMAILAGDEGCSNNYEPNNTKQEATPIAVNTLIRAQIASPSDLDWYSFAISPNQNNVRIILSGLLFNYDIRLVDQNGNLLAVSTNIGNKNDTIIYNGLPQGNFYVKVYGRKGSYSSVDCYSLMVETSANTFREAEQQNSIDELSSLNVFPNPFSSATNIQFSLPKNSSIEISLVDLEGRKIKTIAAGNFDEGDHQVTLRKENIPPGVYLLQLKLESGIATSKLIVQ